MPNEEKNENGKKDSGIESLAQETISQEPRIDEEVITNLEEKEKSREQAESNAEPSQSNEPESFNPDIHVVDSAGNPIRKKDGTFKKKPGRKSGAAKQAPNTNSPNPTNPPLDYANMAHGFLGLGFTAAQMFLGEHWKPEPQEYQFIHMQTVRCMEFYNMPDVPPAIALVAAVAMYAGPRYLDQRTHEYINSRKQVKNQAKQDKPSA